ncbi:ragulator complex protein LAMTOR4-like [Liolophura sinensis]|uniref:ragulator complex protein LAMTOR4-like n=1 Tax=Liolophura sinensis TaxID=3198878 RepID=UPI0031593C5E
MATQGLERIQDSLGYLVLTEEGAVIASGGDLENDERRANYFMSLAQTTSKVKLSDRRDTFKRVSVVWEDIMYVITVSNHKVYVCKRPYAPQDPILA